MRLNKDTQLCMSLAARPGNFGTRFHNFLYEALELNFVYKAFTTTDIRSAVGGIRALGIRGSAISMPFKESCMEFLDEIDPSAAGIQSVNTIVNTNGKLRGGNTDYVAVRKLLEGHSGTFALFGSGGMAKASACALRDAGLSGVIVARNEKTGRALAEQYGFSWTPKLSENVDVLLNASPVGMQGGPEASQNPFSQTAISGAKLVFDVVANPIETPLIVAARAAGKPVVTGFEVTTLQAVEQFVLYTGVRPPEELIKKAALFARGTA